MVEDIKIHERVASLENEMANVNMLRDFRHDTAKILTHHESAIMRLLESPTNQELQLTLVEMRGDIRTILAKQEDNVAWQDTHQNADNENFTTTAEKIDKLNGISTKIGILGVVMGVVFMKLYNYITGS